MDISLTKIYKEKTYLKSWEDQPYIYKAEVEKFFIDTRERLIYFSRKQNLLLICFKQLVDIFMKVEFLGF